MNKKKCQVCGSSHTVKNGIRNGVQLYKCRDCGYQFRAGDTVSEDELTFTDLKKNLNNHSGLTMENRKRFISGFFLALMETLSMKKQEPH